MERETRKLKVLIASSASTVLPSFKYIIRQTFKHEVLTASEPEEVIKQVELHKNNKPIDLIITGAFKHAETDYTGIVNRVRQIDPYVLCALYTNDSTAAQLAESRGIRMDDCIMKKNGPHADLKPLFDRLRLK